MPFSAGPIPEGPIWLLAVVSLLKGRGLAGALAAIEEALAREPENSEYRQLRHAIERQLSGGEARVPSGDGV